MVATSSAAVGTSSSSPPPSSTLSATEGGTGTGRDRKRKRDAVVKGAVTLLAPAPKLPCTTMTTQQLRPSLDATHPLMFLKLVLSVVPEGKALLRNHTQSFSFRKPSQGEIDSYDLEVVGAVRSGDVDKLRCIMKQGRKTLNACNRFGESLIHMACRRGKVDVVRFLLKEGSTRTDIRDDYGRTPAHDAYWTTEANIEVMDELLQHIPIAMLLTEDVRGFTPFQYARKEHWPRWIEFLQDRRLVLLERLVMDLEAKPYHVDDE
jgi:Ankyrin repeats (3 copies)